MAAAQGQNTEKYIRKRRWYRKLFTWFIQVRRVPESFITSSGLFLLLFFPYIFFLFPTKSILMSNSKDDHSSLHPWTSAFISFYIILSLRNCEIWLCFSIPHRWTHANTNTHTSHHAWTETFLGCEKVILNVSYNMTIIIKMRNIETAERKNLI